MCTGLCRIIREAEDEQYARMRQWAMNVVTEPEDFERSSTPPSPVAIPEAVPAHFAFSFRCPAQPLLRAEAPSFVPNPAQLSTVEGSDPLDYPWAVDLNENLSVSPEAGADRGWTVQHIENAADWTVEDARMVSDEDFNDDDTDDDDSDQESGHDWDPEDLIEDSEVSDQEEQDENEPEDQEERSDDGDDGYCTDDQSSEISNVKYSSSDYRLGNLKGSDTYRGYHWRLVKHFLFIPDVTADDIVNAYMALKVDNRSGEYYHLAWPLETRVMLLLKKHRRCALW